MRAVVEDPLVLEARGANGASGQRDPRNSRLRWRVAVPGSMIGQRACRARISGLQCLVDHNQDKAHPSGPSRTRPRLDASGTTSGDGRAFPGLSV